MSDDLPASARRVHDAARGLGLAIEIREMPHSTRTAEEAAQACGCAVGQIVKSLVFQGKTSGEPYLLLVSGANRVDQSGVAGAIGEALTRPDAQAVRTWTGFAIGGIPPFAHDTPLATFIDQDLMTHAVVWAAAGTPNAVFSVSPAELSRSIKATTIRVA